MHLKLTRQELKIQHVFLQKFALISWIDIKRSFWKMNVHSLIKYVHSPINFLNNHFFFNVKFLFLINYEAEIFFGFKFYSFLYVLSFFLLFFYAQHGFLLSRHLKSYIVFFFTWQIHLEQFKLSGSYLNFVLKFF